MTITINNNPNDPSGLYTIDSTTAISGKTVIGGTAKHKIVIANNVQYTVTGDNGGDTINFSKNTTDNNLFGGTGDDTIKAGNGNNYIVGGGGNDTISAGNGSNTILVGSTTGTSPVSSTVSVGSGNNSISISGNSSDIASISLGKGSNWVSVSGGTANIKSFSNAKDALDVFSGATANVLAITKAWTPDNQTINDGTVYLTTKTVAINLSGAGGTSGWNVTATGSTSLTGSSYNDTFLASGSKDVLTGGGGTDSFYITKGSSTITDLSGNDVLVASAKTKVSATVSANWTAGNTTTDDGAVTLNLNSGVSVDLSNAVVSKGLTIDGSNGSDNIIGSNGNDLIKAGIHDSLTGGAGSDTFSFAKGSTVKGVEKIFGGITDTTLNTVTDYSKGAVGTGDVLQYSSTLKIGGFDAANGVSIDSKTGVVSFTSNPTDLNTAVTELATAFNSHHQGNGTFAFFQLNGTGPEYLYIASAKEASPSSHDNVIQLVGVTSISEISLHGSHLTIIS
ncbi:hypothetical protein KEF85_12550 [Methylomonas paludis]|uniref:Calcium-binding protein n=1 Tax=Methylomonas paludis TaxID=1173101 RepID=A0A975MM62_9GAMM|nr:calcium-binding protein [Methylomonas paludis]QWF70169.1 hypothetical protein KEF85_12550 [Methylomonas paludis]